MTCLGTFAVLLVWFFPRVWYNQTPAPDKFVWLSEHTNLTSWSYAELPLTPGAQSELGSDRYVNGEFRDSGGRAVRVFSAKRYSESETEVDIFAHNPDRCWPLAGWELKTLSPEYLALDLWGTRLNFERRLFQTGRRQELVYFCALVGGEPLPYRMDQYLAFGRKLHQGERSGTLSRAVDPRFWRFIWDSFRSRRALKGVKHFIRISTPVDAGRVSEADALLQGFIGTWLRLGSFKEEFEFWKVRP